MDYSNHHTTPISLGGINKDFNIMRLIQKDHDLIHHTCDISYKLYHILNRKMKTKMNGHILIPEDALKVQHEMQNRFYEGYDNLPEHLTSKIDNVRNKTLQYRNNKLFTVTNDKFDISHDTHKEGLIKEHEMQLIIQKELFNMINKFI